MIEYRESDFLDHIKKHMADYNSSLINPNPNIFVPDFPLEEVLEEIKKYIPSDKRLFPGFYEDVYHFKYEHCGRENNRLVNFFKVVCFNDTQDIITICPISYGDELPYVDLSYMKKEETKKEIKRPSALEKFNRRYGNKKI